MRRAQPLRAHLIIIGITNTREVWRLVILDASGSGSVVVDKATSASVSEPIVVS